MFFMLLTTCLPVKKQCTIKLISFLTRKRTEQCLAAYYAPQVVNHLARAIRNLYLYFVELKRYDCANQNGLYVHRSVPMQKVIVLFL